MSGTDQAFPNGVYRPFGPGLTKRELFAVAILNSMFAARHCWDDVDKTASMAIRQADALLAELAKESK